MTFNERYVALTVPLLAQAKELKCEPHAYATGALATLLLHEQDAHARTRKALEAARVELERHESFIRTQ